MVRRIILFLTLVLSAPLAAQRDAQFGGGGGGGVTVFEDVNFGGRSVALDRDMPDLRSIRMDVRVSSIRVTPGETWEVCDQRDYRGRCQILSRGESDLRQMGWNDRIQSLRRVRGDGGGGGNLLRPNGLELYAGTDFSGQRIILSATTPDLRRAGFSDRALSLRVPRGEAWEICVNINFDDCRVVTEDVRDLRAIGLDRLISSVRKRGSGGRGPEIVLYDQPGYTGRSMTIDRDMATLIFFNNRAGSVRVVRGSWELCDAPSFRGKCVPISRDVRDLSRVGLNDQVSSVRIR